MAYALLQEVSVEEVEYLCREETVAWFVRLRVAAMDLDLEIGP